MIRRFGHYGQLFIDAVGNTFSPPVDATSRQIRGNGALCVVAAILVVALTGAAYFGYRALFPAGPAGFPSIMVVPILLFYVLAIFGGYRLIVGKSPAPAYPGEVSPKRIAYAIASTLLVFALIIGLIAIAAYFFESR